jgi:hypothetical protein
MNSSLIPQSFFHAGLTCVVRPSGVRSWTLNGDCSKIARNQLSEGL